MWHNIALKQNVIPDARNSTKMEVAEYLFLVALLQFTFPANKASLNQTEASTELLRIGKDLSFAKGAGNSLLFFFMHIAIRDLEPFS